MTSTLMMVWIMCCGHPKTWSARLDSNQRVPSRASAPNGVTNQPSLLADMKLGAPWRSRTTDRMLRRHVLYPAELMAHFEIGQGNRVRTCDLIVPNDALYQTELYPERIWWVQ